MKKTPTEEDLKILKWNISATNGYPKLKLKLRGSNQSLKLKTTSMEDDFNTLKVEYLSNRWSDLVQILNLDFKETKPMGTNDLNRRQPQQKMTSKYQKLNISATTGQILSKFET